MKGSEAEDHEKGETNEIIKGKRENTVSQPESRK